MRPAVAQLEKVQSRTPYVVAVSLAVILVAALLGNFDAAAVGWAVPAGLAQCVGYLRWWKLGSFTLMGLCFGAIGIIATKAGHEPVSAWAFLQTTATYLAFALGPLVIWRERARAWLLEGAS